MNDDLIRRSDAIEAITYSHLDNLTREERIAHINALPSADRAQGKWIPCEERLPEDKCDVLIQFGWNMAVGCIDGGDWRINSGDAWCTEVAEDDGKPIAWMPLPEPWKGVDDE